MEHSVKSIQVLNYYWGINSDELLLIIAKLQNCWKKYLARKYF